MTNNDYEIIRSEQGTKVIVPHNDKNVTFFYPFFRTWLNLCEGRFGGKNYAEIREKIESKGLVMPTISELTSLIYTALQNKKKVEFKEVSAELGYGGLCGSEGLYLGNQGVYIKTPPEMREGKIILNESELIEKLEAQDASVKFIPWGFKMGIQKPREYAKNPLVLGLAGEQGAEKLAKIAEAYKRDPHVSIYVSDTEKIFIPTISKGRFNHRIELANTNPNPSCAWHDRRTFAIFP